MVRIYKLIGDNMLFSPIEQVFSNRNISVEDVEWFKNPTPFEYDGSLIKNMDKGVGLVLSHIRQGNHIHIQIDKDLDGVTSSAALINYLKEAFPNINITWTNHVNMKHGIDLILIPETTSLLIVPDAGSNSFEEHRTLHEKGIDVLVIDHHETSHYSEHAIVINPHLDDYPNKQISGVGVVYKFIQCIDRELGTNYHVNYRDLVSFGLVGDAMQTNSKETFWLIKQGLEHIQNEFLIELIKENVDKDDSLTQTALAFKCNPKINSLIRVGSGEELDGLTKAFLNHQEITINNRLRRKVKSETWARRMTRICNNTYARQRRMRDSIMVELEEQIQQEKLYNNRFIVVEVKGEYERNMSGYIAIALVNKYRKPVLVLNEYEDGILRGSLRGYDPLMTDTKDFLSNLCLFDSAEGHQQACGIAITRENLNILNDVINKKLQFNKDEELYTVDFVMDDNSLNDGFVKSMENYSHLFGKGIEKPLYAITSISVNISDIQLLGKEKNVMKFVNNKVEYIQFVGDKRVLEAIDEDVDKTITLDVVGSTSINYWNGNTTAQFVIEGLEIKEIKEKSFEFLF